VRGSGGPLQVRINHSVATPLIRPNRHLGSLGCETAMHLPRSSCEPSSIGDTGVRVSRFGHGLRARALRSAIQRCLSLCDSDYLPVRLDSAGRGICAAAAIGRLHEYLL
jgi:hypothetical protein